MAKIDRLNSILVQRQLPDFVNRDHGKFVQLLEKFYEFSESVAITIDDIILDGPKIIQEGSTVTYKVEVKKIGGIERFFINGISSPTITLNRGDRIVFDLRSDTLLGHSFAISETYGGTNVPEGKAYSNGISYVGTQGVDGYMYFDVPQNSPDTLYYFCEYVLSLAGTSSIIVKETTFFEFEDESLLQLEESYENDLQQFILGEEIRGVLSGTRARVSGRKEDTTTFVYIDNDSEFVVGEKIIGQSSRTIATIYGLSRGSTNATKNLENYVDISRTSEGFVEELRKQFAESLDVNLVGDKRLFLKYVRDFYRSKGSPDSFKYLFRILFDTQDLDIVYPKDNILRVSDGRWTLDTTIRVETGTAKNIRLFSSRYLYGTVSNATAIVDRVVTYYLGYRQVTELYLSNIEMGRGPDGELTYFLPDEIIQSGIDENGEYAEAKVLSIIEGIDVEYGGKEYSVGDEVIISGGGGVFAKGRVKTLQDGVVESVTVDDGGDGYSVGDPVIFSAPSEDGVRALGVVTKIIPSWENIVYGGPDFPTMSEIGDIQIGSADYGVSINNADKNTHFYSDENTTYRIDFASTPNFNRGDTLLTTSVWSWSPQKSGVVIAVQGNSVFYSVTSYSSDSVGNPIIQNFVEGDTLYAYDRSKNSDGDPAQADGSDSYPQPTGESATILYGPTNDSVVDFYGAFRDYYLKAGPIGSISRIGIVRGGSGYVTIPEISVTNNEISSLSDYPGSVGPRSLLMNFTGNVANQFIPGRKIVGERSGAEALVLCLVRSSVTLTSSTIRISPISGNFVQSSYINDYKEDRISLHAENLIYVGEDVIQLNADGTTPADPIRGSLLPSNAVYLDSSKAKGNNAVILIDEITSGAIKEIQMTDFGLGYTADPTIQVLTSGVGGAILKAKIGTLCKYPGYYIGQTGLISSGPRIQDSKYYQEYSYVLRTGLDFQRYRTIIRRMVHPAGLALFGEVVIRSYADARLFRGELRITNNERPFISRTLKLSNESFVPESLEPNSYFEIQPEIYSTSAPFNLNLQVSHGASNILYEDALGNDSILYENGGEILSEDRTLYFLLPKVQIGEKYNGDVLAQVGPPKPSVDGPTENIGIEPLHEVEIELFTRKIPIIDPYKSDIIGDYSDIMIKNIAARDVLTENFEKQVEIELQAHFGWDTIDLEDASGTIIGQYETDPISLYFDKEIKDFVEPYISLAQEAYERDKIVIQHTYPRISSNVNLLPPILYANLKTKDYLLLKETLVLFGSIQIANITIDITTYRQKALSGFASLQKEFALVAESGDYLMITIDPGLSNDIIEPYANTQISFFSDEQIGEERLKHLYTEQVDNEQNVHIKVTHWNEVSTKINDNFELFLHTNIEANVGVESTSTEIRYDKSTILIAGVDGLDINNFSETQIELESAVGIDSSSTPAETKKRIEIFPPRLEIGDSIYLTTEAGERLGTVLDPIIGTYETDVIGDERFRDVRIMDFSGFGEPKVGMFKDDILSEFDDTEVGFLIRTYSDFGYLKADDRTGLVIHSQYQAVAMPIAFNVRVSAVVDQIKTGNEEAEDFKEFVTLVSVEIAQINSLIVSVQHSIASVVASKKQTHYESWKLGIGTISQSGNNVQGDAAYFLETFGLNILTEFGEILTVEEEFILNYKDETISTYSDQTISYLMSLGGEPIERTEILVQKILTPEVDFALEQHSELKVEDDTLDDIIFVEMEGATIGEFDNDRIIKYAGTMIKDFDSGRRIEFEDERFNFVLDESSTYALSGIDLEDDSGNVWLEDIDSFLLETGQGTLIYDEAQMFIVNNIANNSFLSTKNRRGTVDYELGPYYYSDTVSQT